MVTFDNDFLEHFKPIETHPGIIVIQVHPNTDHYVIPAFKKFLVNVTTIEFQNNTIIIICRFCFSKEKVVNCKIAIE